MDMARKKRGEVKRLPIELDLNDPAQKRVWERWLELSEQGEAAKWAREALISALRPGERSLNRPPPVELSHQNFTRQPQPSWQGRPTPKPGSDKRSSARYEKVEEE